VLETYLKAVVGADVFETLAHPNQKLSFNLPFNLPLAELRLYLGHFNIALHDVYRTLREPAAKVWRERLKISAEEFRVLRFPDPAGVTFRFGNPANFGDFPVTDFTRFAGITREQLDELLRIGFSADVRNVRVARQRIPDELQNFPEILQNLTPNRLDVMHRFVRLWRKTGWSLPDFDRVVTALVDGGVGGPDIGSNNGALVLGLAQLVDIQEKLTLHVEELCALVHDLPVSADFPRPPAKQADRRLYERLFDLKAIFGEHDPNTHEVNTQVAFHHYSLNAVNPNDQTIDPKTPAVLGALGVSETELLLLFDLLKNEMPFDANGDTTLDRRRLSLLFRHARLAKALKLSVDDFIQALALNFAPGGRVLTTLAQIHHLRDFVVWLKGSPFTVSELRFVLAGVRAVRGSSGPKWCHPTDRVGTGLIRRVRAVYDSPRHWRGQGRRSARDDRCCTGAREGGSLPDVQLETM
jgi:hypothetical protein